MYSQSNTSDSKAAMQQNTAYSSHNKRDIPENTPENIYEMVESQAQESDSPQTLNNTAMTGSQQIRSLWGFICVSTIIAVFALAIAVTAVVLSSNIVGDDVKREIHIIQLQLNTLDQVLNMMANDSIQEIKNLQAELLKLTEKLVLSQNGKKIII